MPRSRRTTIIVTTVAVVAVAALGLGAWALAAQINGSFHIAGGPAAAAEKTPTSAATPLDEEAAAKLAAEKAAKGLAVGAVLTAEQAKAISHHWQGQLLPYTMADGRQVLIARDQPLPENVKADAGKKLTAAAQAGAAQGDPINGPLIPAMKTVGFEVGHPVKCITYLKTYVGPDYEHEDWIWMNGTDGVTYDSAQAAIEGLGPLPAGTEVIVSQ